jgi:predicted acetyltransferase
MNQHAPPASPHIEVAPAAREQEPILANLLELYAHDFSEFHNLQIGEDGRFGYRLLPLYWSEPDRHAFFVRMDGALAGLALVKRGSEVSGDAAVWDMAEFFIVRGFRRRGIGTQAAHAVWRRFPGTWEIRVMQANVAAHHFWAAAIATFVGHAIHPLRIESGGESWAVFSFESGRATLGTDAGSRSCHD